MRSPARRLAAALCLALLLTACATKQATSPAPGTATTAPAPVAPGQPTATSPELHPGTPGTAAWLFPSTHQQLTFTITDFDQKPQQVTETLIASVDEIIATQGGTPYAAWLLRSDGVWRRDPKGPDLLRYLPATLTDGETWQQQSGDSKVSFALHRGEQCPMPRAHTVHAGECWTLTVLNRGERTFYQFAAGLGPVAALSANYGQPAASYYTVMETAEPVIPSNSEIMSAKEKAPRATGGVPYPIAALTPAAFDAVLDTYPRVGIMKIDLAGDGQQERVRGVFSSWTYAPLEVVGADGKRLATQEPVFGESHLWQPLPVPALNVTLLLDLWHSGAHNSWMTAYTLAKRDNTAQLVQVGGWDIKATSTPATRVQSSAEGTITVEWDLGDPAGHTRIRTYQVTSNFRVNRVAERFAPATSALLYPSDPLGVLTAAFDAYWLELPDELARYLATPAALQDFQAYLGQKKVAKPEQHYPVDVSFATLTKQGEHCNLQFAPAALGADNTAPFTADWGG